MLVTEEIPDVPSMEHGTCVKLVKTNTNYESLELRTTF